MRVNYQTQLKPNSKTFCQKEGGKVRSINSSSIAWWRDSKLKRNFSFWNLTILWRFSTSLFNIFILSTPRFINFFKVDSLHSLSHAKQKIANDMIQIKQCLILLHFVWKKFKNFIPIAGHSSHFSIVNLYLKGHKVINVWSLSLTILTFITAIFENFDRTSQKSKVGMQSESKIFTVHMLDSCRNLLPSITLIVTFELDPS